MRCFLVTLFLILYTNLSHAAYSNISAYENKTVGSFHAASSNLPVIENPDSRPDEKNCVIVTKRDGMFCEAKEKISLTASIPKKFTNLPLNKKLLVSLQEEFSETSNTEATSLDKTSISLAPWALINKDESFLQLIKEEEFPQYAHLSSFRAISSEHCWYFQPKKRGWTYLGFAQATINPVTKKSSDETYLVFFIYIS